MDRPVDLTAPDASGHDAFATETFAEEFDRLIREDDGSAADEILASGQLIYISREDTPSDHVICVRPDGTEELLAMSWDDIARLLGQ